MKLLTFIMAAVLLCCGDGLFAQISPDHSYEMSAYGTVGHSETILYNYHYRPKVYDTQYLTIFSKEGEEKSTIEIKSKQGAIIEACFNLGKNTVFFFELNYSKDILFLVVDENGNEHARNQITYPGYNSVEITPAGEDRFCLFADVKIKKRGIQVECFDLGLNSVWKYMNIPEKGKFHLKAAGTNKNGEAAFLYMVKNTDYRMATLTADGTLIGDEPVSADGLRHYSPYRMQFNADNSFYLFADYGSSNEEVHNTRPIGMSIKKFDRTAKEIQNEKLVFEEVAKRFGDLKNVVEFTPNDVPCLRLVDVQILKGKETLIFESYLFNTFSKTTTKNGQPTTIVYKSIILKDLYLLELGNEMEEAHRIWKSTRKLEFEGVKFYDATDLCGLIEASHAFGYQGLIGENIVIKGVGQNFEYLNTVHFNENWEDVSTRRYFGKPVSEHSGGPKNVQQYKLELGRPISRLGNGQVICTGAGGLFYRYNKEFKQLELTQIN